MTADSQQPLPEKYKRENLPPEARFEVPRSVELREQAEAKAEKKIELIDRDDHAVEQELTRAKIEMATPAPIVKTKTPARRSVEGVLSANLAAVYNKMDARTKLVFKNRGEETSRRIEILMRKTKLEISTVLALIRRWLATIPGVNDFYLEQEAKIKTDQIIKLATDLKARGEI